MPKRDKNNNEIAYQHNDIVMKMFTDVCKGKSLAIFDSSLSKVKETLPTNLPTIRANELKIDNLFLLENGEFLIVDYESQYKDDNKIKYGYYTLDIYKKYKEEYPNIKIKIMVLYTTKTKPKNTKNILDLGALSINIKEVFITDLNSELIRKEIFEKISKRERLKEEDLIKLIILPMTYENNNDKQISISEVAEQCKYIDDNDDKLFVLSGLNVFSNNVISNENTLKIKEMIKMLTTAGKEFVKEKIEYGEEQREIGILVGVKEGKMEANNMIAKEMLKNNYDDNTILNIIKDLTLKELRQIKKEL